MVGKNSSIHSPQPEIQRQAHGQFMMVYFGEGTSMNRRVKRTLVVLLFLFLGLEFCHSGTNVFQIPKAPEGAVVNIYYSVDLSAERNTKLKVVDEARDIKDARHYLEAQGITLEAIEFAYYFSAMRCLIVGASRSTQDQLVFLFD
jgi:hypothetical protein